VTVISLYAAMDTLRHLVLSGFHPRGDALLLASIALPLPMESGRASASARTVSPRVNRKRVCSPNPRFGKIG
jgi:hypothetical protein